MLRHYAWCGAAIDPSSTADLFRVVPGARCKQCDRRLTQPEELKWRVCNDCVAVCEHTYVKGAGNNRGQLAYMTFCNVCGRADPDWQPSADPVEDMLRVVAEGVVTMLVITGTDPDGAAIITRQ